MHGKDGVTACPKKIQHAKFLSGILIKEHALNPTHKCNISLQPSKNNQGLITWSSDPVRLYSMVTISGPLTVRHTIKRSLPLSMVIDLLIIIVGKTLQRIPICMDALL